MHSGPEDQTLELLDYAQDMAAAEGASPALAVVAPSLGAALPPGVAHLPVYPARNLFPLADRIISACGFNVMAETASFRAIHRFVPMTRRFDDQFARAQQMRAKVRVRLGEVLSDEAVLVMPTSPGPAPLLTEDQAARLAELQ